MSGKEQKDSIQKNKADRKQPETKKAKDSKKNLKWINHSLSLKLD